MLQRCGQEKQAPEVCVMCGISLAMEQVKKHIGQHMLDTALFTLPHPVADENPKIPIEGVKTSLDKATQQIPGSLGNSVLGWNSGSNDSYDVLP